ncbi:MAG: hypothetical protein IPI14_10880 [Polaromonas sp.]|nr:hypothetical protein [Polaromonas sp.]
MRKIKSSLVAQAATLTIVPSLLLPLVVVLTAQLLVQSPLEQVVKRWGVASDHGASKFNVFYFAVNTLLFCQ